MAGKQSIGEEKTVQAAERKINVCVPLQYHVTAVEHSPHSLEHTVHTVLIDLGPVPYSRITK